MLNNNQKSQDNREKKIRFNNQITSSNILLIDENGEKLGAYSIVDALRTAFERGVDLIEINSNPSANESVCRLGDFSKFLFEKKKKDKFQNKQQRESAIDLKEIYIKCNTNSHDLEIKAKKTLEFIENGDRVRVCLKLYGREISKKDVARKTFEDFMTFIDVAFIEKPMYNEGNNLAVTLYKK